MIVQFLFQFRPISGIPGKLVFNKHFTKVAALTSSVGENYIFIYYWEKMKFTIKHMCHFKNSYTH